MITSEDGKKMVCMLLIRTELATVKFRSWQFYLLSISKIKRSYNLGCVGATKYDRYKLTWKQTLNFANSDHRLQRELGKRTLFHLQQTPSFRTYQMHSVTSSRLRSFVCIGWDKDALPTFLTNLTKCWYDTQFYRKPCIVN